MKKVTALASLLTLALLAICDASIAAPLKYVSIGTGNITGVYYPTGGAICRLSNMKRNNMRCSVESTGGSVANINAIRSGILDFGIVQSDWQYHSYNGTNIFSDQKPFKELRSVFSLYTETFSVAVTEKSGIKKIDDIVGKIVNFGPQGSGMYGTMEVLAKAKGWTKSSFAKVTDLQPSEQPRALCDGKIDVMVFISGNPNGVLQEATQRCKTKILSIDHETIDRIVATNPFYVHTEIPGGMYASNKSDIQTFGVKASLLTSSKMSDEVVYSITKSLFDNFENFKTLHPVFSSLKKEDMVKKGNLAPMHPGAEKFFKEAGLLK